MVDLLAIQALAHRSLSGTASWDAPSIYVALGGSGDATAAGDLRAFMTAVEECARRLRAIRMVIDVRAVNLLSSSCLSAFVSLVVNASELPRQERMRIEFRIAPERWWQDRSFAAIQALEPDLVQITQIRAA